MKSSLLLILLTVLIGCGSESGNFINTSDGIDLYYEEYGSGKPTLIFVHGWTNDASTWDDQTSYFKDKYHVVVLDLPGFGRSGSNRSHWSMQRYGEDVAELTKELNLESIILIGSSMGGPIAFEAEKLLRGSVRAIVLVDVMNSLKFQWDSTFATNFYENYKDNYTSYDYQFNYFGKDSSLVNRYLAMIPSSIPKFWFPPLHEVFKWLGEDAISSVSKVNIPIRAINSDKSELKIEEWDSCAKDFKAIIIENSHHYLHWEYPDKFNRTLHNLIQEITE